MKDNRTLLGKVTYGILLTNVIMQGIYYLCFWIQMTVMLSEGRVPEKSGLIVGVMVLMAVICVIAIIPQYLLFRAFKTNFPWKLRGVSIFYVVTASIYLFFNLIGCLLDISDNGFDFVALTLLLIYIVLLCVADPRNRNGFRNAWIFMIFLGFVYYFGNVLQCVVQQPEDILVMVILLIGRVFMTVGLILLSYWAVYQEKFYIEEEDEGFEEVVYGYSAVVPSNDYTSQLHELKKLLDDGIITQEDYDKKKAQILGI